MNLVKDDFTPESWAAWNAQRYVSYSWDEQDDWVSRTGRFYLPPDLVRGLPGLPKKLRSLLWRSHLFWAIEHPVTYTAHADQSSSLIELTRQVLNRIQKEPPSFEPGDEEDSNDSTATNTPTSLGSPI